MKNRHCPNCKTDLRGENIYEYFLAKYNDEVKAKQSADMFGGDGYFYKTISVYSFERDRTTHYRCPDCFTEWER